jgi:hypothetical protein
MGRPTKYPDQFRNPSGGTICPACIERFNAFRRYAPGVGLTAVARSMQWQDSGPPRYGDGSVYFR